MSKTIKDANERRQELLSIGLELYMKGGAAAISIKKIVKQADVAIGLFYYYFESKDLFIEEMINNVIQSKIGKIFDILSSKSINIIDKVGLAIDTFFTHINDILPIINENDLHTSQHHILSNKLTENLKKPILNLLEQGVTQKLFNIEYPEVCVIFILNGLSGALHSDLVLQPDLKSKVIVYINKLLGICEVNL